MVERMDYRQVSKPSKNTNTQDYNAVRNNVGIYNSLRPQTSDGYDLNKSRRCKLYVCTDADVKGAESMDGLYYNTWPCRSMVGTLFD